MAAVQLMCARLGMVTGYGRDPQHQFSQGGRSAFRKGGG
jgi:hypothetical protein